MRKVIVALACFGLVISALPIDSSVGDESLTSKMDLLRATYSVLAVECGKRQDAAGCLGKSGFECEQKNRGGLSSIKCTNITENGRVFIIQGRIPGEPLFLRELVDQ